MSAFSSLYSLESADLRADPLTSKTRPALSSRHTSMPMLPEPTTDALPRRVSLPTAVEAGILKKPAIKSDHTWPDATPVPWKGVAALTNESYLSTPSFSAGQRRLASAASALAVTHAVTTAKEAPTAKSEVPAVLPSHDIIRRAVQPKHETLSVGGPIWHGISNSLDEDVLAFGTVELSSPVVTHLEPVVEPIDEDADAIVLRVSVPSTSAARPPAPAATHTLMPHSSPLQPRAWLGLSNELDGMEAFCQPSPSPPPRRSSSAPKKLSSPLADASPKDKENDFQDASAAAHHETSLGVRTFAKSAYFDQAPLSMMMG